MICNYILRILVISTMILLHRRRDSGDSVSQWWHWQENSNGRPVVRSTSLKGDLNNQRHQQRADECDADDDDDEVFVTGHRSQGQVKSAMIVSAAGSNPYCTGSRDDAFYCFCNSFVHTPTIERDFFIKSFHLEGYSLGFITYKGIFSTGL